MKIIHFLIGFRAFLLVHNEDLKVRLPCLVDTLLMAVEEQGPAVPLHVNGLGEHAHDLHTFVLLRAIKVCHARILELDHPVADLAAYLIL